MPEIVKHINDTNASYRNPMAGDAKNTDLFLDSDHYDLFKEEGDQITVRLSKENLSQAILFVASILPRKYDNSSDHRTVNYSPDFVYQQLRILDLYFTQNGKPVNYKTQVWKIRKDAVKKNGKIDNRFYFNGLIEPFSYSDANGKLVKAKFSIRNYLAGGYSNLNMSKAEDGIFDVWINNTSDYKDENKKPTGSFNIFNVDLPLQQIIYGAPGTGKSFSIDEDVKKYHLNTIRTTFHPDSDYATFVGAYKPQMERVGKAKKQILLDFSTLVDKFKEYLDAKPVNITKACSLFGFDYHDSIVNMENYGKTIVDLVSDAYKSGTTYDSQVRAGMSVYEQHSPNETCEKKIVYKYSKQAFLKAYVAAWKDLENPYVLVIEEINRGNCAQIFGDLFQLLDRNDKGFSSYPISPDTDIMQELNDEFDGLEVPNADAINSLYNEEVVSEVLSGNKLILPNNLYIWATMNTSDQSLFPIDSAFKRRWEWKYVPISDAGKRWTVLANGVKYDWWSFLDNINRKIWDATHSEDKKLGYFFCKANAEDGIITADKFVGKVLFYIYNDVFKDYGFDDAIFHDENDEENPELLFKDFFLPNGKPREDKIQVFLKNLGVKTESEAAEIAPAPYDESTEVADESSTGAMDADGPSYANKPGSEKEVTYSFDGKSGLSYGGLAIEVIKKFMAEHPDLTYKQLQEQFPDDMMGEEYKLSGLFASKKALDSAPYDVQKKNYERFKTSRKFKSSDNIEFFINGNWNSANIPSIIEFAEGQGWAISKEE